MQDDLNEKVREVRRVSKQVLFVLGGTLSGYGSYGSYGWMKENFSIFDMFSNTTREIVLVVVFAEGLLNVYVNSNNRNFCNPSAKM